MEVPNGILFFPSGITELQEGGVAEWIAEADDSPATFSGDKLPAAARSLVDELNRRYPVTPSLEPRCCIVAPCFPQEPVELNTNRSSSGSHEDIFAFWCFGSHCSARFWREDHSFDLALPPHSLCILKGPALRDWQCAVLALEGPCHLVALSASTQKSSSSAV